MRRIVLFFLTIVLLTSMTTSCGRPNTSDTGGNQVVQKEGQQTGPSSDVLAKDAGNPSNAADLGGIYKGKGTELTDYLGALTDSESRFEEPLNKLTDMASAFASMDRVIVNLALLNLPQYDILSVEDLDREEGTMMLSGSKGVRERKGNEIKFHSEKEYTEDQMNNKKGDKYSEQGVLNTKDNTLIIESKTERDGKVISRTVVEAVILKNGTYLLQYLSASQPRNEGDPIDTTAVFKRYNQKEYSAVTADFDGKVDFAYDSIIGKGDIQTDAMASKYKINGIFTVKDDKAAFSQK